MMRLCEGVTVFQYSTGEAQLLLTGGLTTGPRPILRVRSGQGTGKPPQGVQDNSPFIHEREKGDKETGGLVSSAPKHFSSSSGEQL